MTFLQPPPPQLLQRLTPAVGQGMKPIGRANYVEFNNSVDYYCKKKVCIEHQVIITVCTLYIPGIRSPSSWWWIANRQNPYLSSKCWWNRPRTSSLQSSFHSCFNYLGNRNESFRCLPWSSDAMMEFKSIFAHRARW